MATGLTIGGDAQRALEDVTVPSYALDTTGIVRWINPAAEKLLGDVRGRHFTSVVAPEDRRRARELFARKLLGTAAATDAPGVLVSTDGTRLAVELSAVPLKSGERVVGVFGLYEDAPKKAPQRRIPTSPPVRSRCFACSNRAARRSRSPPSFTSAPRRSRTTSAASSGPSAYTPDSKPSPSPGPHHPTDREQSSERLIPAF